MSNLTSGLTPDNPEHETQIFELIRQSLKGLKFGTVEIVIHDRHIVQVERREKIRPVDLTRERKENQTTGKN